MGPAQIGSLSEFFESLDTTLLIRSQYAYMADRPDDDASSAEIARWMEEDFWESVTDGIGEINEDVSTDE